LGKLNEVITEIRNFREVLIAADFNSRKRNNNQFVGRFGEEIINDNGDKLIDVCEQISLKVFNRYFKHKDTSAHIAPRYTGATKICNRLQDIRVFR
jgi:hypothetical protein